MKQNILEMKNENVLIELFFGLSYRLKRRILILPPSYIYDYICVYKRIKCAVL